MILPIGDDNPRTSTPYVTWLLILVNVLVWLGTLFEPDPGAFYRRWGFVPGDWRMATLVTSMFLHGGLFHLVGNMLYLWIVGDNVEEKLGSGLYLVLYLLGGAAAAFLHLALTGRPDIPLVGASGAISAVIGMYLVFFPRNEIKVLVWYLVLVRTIYVRATWAIGFWFFLQVLYLGYASVAGVSTGVAHGAHVGGFVFGVAVAFVFDRTGFKRMEVFKPPLDTMGRPDRAQPRRRRKQPERTIEPGSVESRMRSAFENGRPAQAADLYLALRFTRGGHTLPPDLQLQVADAMSFLGWHRYAAEAYRLFLDRHRDAPGTGHALVGLARIHALGLSEFDEAIAYLQRAEALDLEPPDRRTLEEVRQRVKGHLDRFVADGQTLGDRVTVIRQTDDRIDPSRYGKIVQEVTGEPMADVTRRLSRGRVLIGHGLPAAMGRDLARRLQKSGLPVLVIDDDRLVGLPELRFARAVDLTRKGLTVTLTTGEKFDKDWPSIFLIAGAWVEEIRDPASSSLVPDIEPFVLGYHGMSVVRTKPVPERFESMARQARRIKESWPVLDVFCFDPWSRIRLRTAQFSVQGKKTNLKSFCRGLLRRGGSVAMNQGVYVMADRGSKTLLTFESQRHLNEYERWLLQLAEYNRVG